MPVRMLLATTALLVGLAAPSPAPAATLAACSGDTVAVLPWPPRALQGTCAGGPFTLGSATSVTLRLEPSAHFTGSLALAVRLGAPNGAGPDVSGYFVDGTLVPFTGATSAQVVLGPGTWYLDVRAGTTQGRICPSQPLPTECRYLPAVAHGHFAGSVVG